MKRMKVKPIVKAALEKGETIYASEFAAINGFQKQSVTSAIASLFRENPETIERLKQGNRYYYTMKVKKPLLPPPPLPVEAWHILWESDDKEKVLIERTDGIWFATKVGG